MSEMIHAALDTSNGISVALMRQGALLFNESMPVVGRDSDRELLVRLLDFFRAADVRLADVTHWTVGRGPGSFSGLRAGIALVHGFCLGAGSAARGIASTAAVAWSAGQTLSDGERIVVLNDARRRQIIVSEYLKSGDSVVPAAEPRITGAAEVAALFPTTRKVATVQADAILPLFTAEEQKIVECYDSVDAAVLLTLSAGWWPTGTERIDSLEPVYVRPPVFVPPVSPRLV